jgi:general secretion pathway protein G
MNQNQKGFTLMEMLIVVTIMAILAAIILPRVMTSSDSAKKSAHKSERQGINSQIEMFNFKFNNYPSAMTKQGWGAEDSDTNGTVDWAEYFPEGVPERCNYKTDWQIDPTTHRISMTGHTGHESD